MRYTAILVPGQDEVSVLVPALPGCFSAGRTRDEAVAKSREAIRGWVAAETEQGRAPLTETPAVLIDGVKRALEIIEETRQAGEIPGDRGYELELVTVHAPHPVPA